MAQSGNSFRVRYGAARARVRYEAQRVPGRWLRLACRGKSAWRVWRAEAARGSVQRGKTGKRREACRRRSAAMLSSGVCACGAR